MKPKTIDLDVADASLTGFASNVTGATFTIATTAPTDGLAHQVSIRNDSATNHSGKTVTLVGTDADGRAQTEVVTGPGTSATVESTKYFATLTSATPSATIGADTFDIGWVDEVASKTILVNRRGGLVSHIFYLDGTLTYDLEGSNVNPNDAGAGGVTVSDQEDMLWDQLSGVTDGPYNAYRVVLTSYSSGARMRWSYSQSAV